MNKIVLIISLIFAFGKIGFGQFELSPVKEWTTVSSNTQFKLSYIYDDCRIPSQGMYAEYIYLMWENTSKETITISWFNDTYYDGKCTNCDHNSRDRKRTITLKPGEKRTGECKVGLNEGLRIHSKWLDLKGRPELEKLMVTDISVSSIDK